MSFPVQTLGKCAKMIPVRPEERAPRRERQAACRRPQTSGSWQVMIWGRFILSRRYTASDYSVALAITAGCTLFISYGTPQPGKTPAAELAAPPQAPAAWRAPAAAAAAAGEVHSSAAKKAADTSLYGMLLMAGYLGFDGFTSTFQDKLFKGYQMETYNQMLWVTMCSAAVSTFWLLGDSSMGAALAFVRRHPECLQGICMLSLSSTLGQLFILYTIREFGSLVFATIMTSRQFLSILLSCLLFLHPLTPQQWVGTATVFGALYYQSFARKPGHHPKPSKEGAAEDAAAAGGGEGAASKV